MRNAADKKSKMIIKEDIMIEARSLAQRYDRVGALYAKAVERGEFDNLEGAGKPLNLEENPYEPADLRMIHKVLKDNGFAPYWLELSKEIDALRDKLNREVDYFNKYTRIVSGQKRSSEAIRRYELKKTAFYTQSRERLEEISKKILDYNLNCPVSRLGRANFDIDDEISRIVKEIEIVTDNQKIY